MATIRDSGFYGRLQLAQDLALAAREATQEQRRQEAAQLRAAHDLVLLSIYTAELNAQDRRGVSTETLHAG
jgi:hypothetical protein